MARRTLNDHDQAVLATAVPEQYERYWNVLRERICARCLDGDGEGNCCLEAGRECAMQKYLELVVNAVNRVDSNQVADYVVELRSIVCAQCDDQNPETGRCSLRTTVECALDRYFPLIIEAIEEVTIKSRRSTP